VLPTPRPLEQDSRLKGQLPQPCQSPTEARTTLTSTSHIAELTASQDKKSNSKFNLDASILEAGNQEPFAASTDSVRYRSTTCFGSQSGIHTFFPPVLWGWSSGGQTNCSVREDRDALRDFVKRTLEETLDMTINTPSSKRTTSAWRVRLSNSYVLKS
jgi:hypothetical protein